MTPRSIAFVMVEIGSLFLVISGVMFPWSRVLTLDWTEITSFFGQALVPPFCFFVSFYGSDLYSLRVVRNLVEFRKRLWAALLGSFLLLVALSLFVSTPRLVESSVLSSLLIIVIGSGVVILLR